MLIIGSQAMKHWGLLPEGVEPRDTDIICTFDEFRTESARIKAEEGMTRCVPLSDKKFHVRNAAGWNYEFEIAWPGSSGEDLLKMYQAGQKYAYPDALLALKLSHRYLKNSPHFLKTMRTIQHLRAAGVEVGPGLEDWLVKREAETYVYKHPKLDVSKQEFFAGDGVNYVYDHDSIHETVALLPVVPKCCVPTLEEEALLANGDCQPEELWGGKRPTCHKCLNAEPVHRPAYTFYMKDGAAVMTSKEKFFAVDEQIRLFGVYEETCVLALERSQIPHGLGKEGGPTPRWSFEMALMKVCTSITSGWFREFAWENYDKVLDLYEQLGEDDFIKRFERNKHLLKPFKQEE